MKTLLRWFVSSVVVFLLLCVCTLRLSGAGKVYLVLGSDTAIWDGMNVAAYSPTYNQALYTDPSMNAYKVMDPLWRLKLKDSYGTPMKLTWWMMAGNLYRTATNTNVPVPNTMTLYLMKKYHDDRIRQYGDELSLHYHTFAWTDYNQDGKYYWNQARTFDECRDDFDVTVAQFLLEENVFPVSFRSGWHFMDNSWQHYLNELLLYSMHDDFPAKRFVTNEPIDNNFDWSLSSSTWVPFRPSDANYQLGGGSRGYNLRSEHIGSVTSAVMDSMFVRASKGTDQVACLWGHLPEEDFLTNLEKINTLAHASETKYSGVQFRYCSAVEAMQRWRQSADSTSPVLTLSSEPSGDRLSFTVTSNEPIFQTQPFVAQKDIYERVSVLKCTKTGAATWKAESTVPAFAVAKVAVALTDTMGNLATRSLNLLPDDVFLDNRDSAYSEVRGAWTTTTNAAWGTDARQAVLAQNDSVTSMWTHTITQTANYNFFLQIPTYANAAMNSTFRVRADGALVGERRFSEMIFSKTWVHLGTYMLAKGARVTVERTVNGAGQAGRIAASDVLKISALVRDRAISVKQTVVDLGDISEQDTARFMLTITNEGVLPLTVQSISAASKAVTFPEGTSFVIPAMSARTVPVRVYASERGRIADTIRVASDDPLVPVVKIALSTNVIAYFAVADNDDSATYTETGSWSKSVATDCIGTTSRFAPLGPGSRAVFRRVLPKSGLYDIQEYLPKTVNASKRARYTLRVNGQAIDTVFLDQNAGSGGWAAVRRRELPAHVPIEVEVTDASVNTSENLVLRADAVRFVLKLETAVERQTAASGVLPSAYGLAQNYPNPFNPSTMIAYALPCRSQVKIEVFNTVGQLIDVLADAVIDAGSYRTSWHAMNAPSGLYFVRMRAQAIGQAAGSFNETRKMILMR